MQINIVYKELCCFLCYFNQPHGLCIITLYATTSAIASAKLILQFSSVPFSFASVLVLERDDRDMRVSRRRELQAATFNFEVKSF